MRNGISNGINRNGSVNSVSISVAAWRKAAWLNIGIACGSLSVMASARGGVA